jgi:hypothetical protein
MMGGVENFTETLRLTDDLPPGTLTTDRGAMGVTAVDQWVVDFYGVVDSMDAAAVAEAFSSEGTFRFGNSAPAVGRREIEQSCAHFFSMIGGLHHDITGLWTGSWDGGEVRSVEANVTYTRQDGTLIEPLPATTTLRMRGDQVEHCCIFVDVSPLFADPTLGELQT